MWGNGSTFYTGGYYYQSALLIQWDSAGTALWNRTWGSYEYVADLWGDESNIFTVTRDSYGYGYNNLIKWDGAGNMVWNHSVSGYSGTTAYAIWGNHSDLYTSGRNSSNSCALVKWTATGAVVWIRNASAYASSCLWGNDQCIYVAAPGMNDRNITLLKWDGDGNLLWSRSYDLGISVSGGWSPKYLWGSANFLYITVGNSAYFTSGQVGDFFVKVDINGNLSWKKQLAANDWVTLDYVWGNENETYTCGAHTFSIIIAKWDAEGTVLWNQQVTRGELGSAWGNSTAVFISGQNDYSHNLIIVKISLQPFEWHRVIVPIACAGGITSIVGYIIWKDRKMKKVQVAISSRKREYFDEISITCPNCGKLIAKRWEHCPYCGNRPIS